METGFSTPLLEFFRKGDVTQDVKMAAAQGALAPRALEQIGLLVLLQADADPEIAKTAEATLASIPRESLAAFLGRPDVPADMRAFFAARGIEAISDSTVDTDAPMVDTSATTDEVKDGEIDEGTALQRLAAMNVPQKVQRATKGSREERAILIRDPNRMISLAVLSSPKITITEIEAFARGGNISEDCLRVIAMTRAWMKNYNVVAALARNPKTPIGISMNLLARLSEKDLKIISTDRNVADVIRVTARKKVVIDK